MVHHTLRWFLLVGAALPSCYYLLGIYCAYQFFRRRPGPSADATPPVSILKPVRGLDREAYENFASFCRLDYPDYEILFAVADGDDPVIPVIRKLIADFPERAIRLLVGSEIRGANRKVNKLCRLAREARHDLLVINDSDVRVDPGYLKAVVAPFRDPHVGAVTCMFRGRVNDGLGSQLEAVGNASEFFAGVLTAWQLEGMAFTLGATMAVTRCALDDIGGFEALADFHADDYELGKRIAARGYRVELSRHTVWIVYPAQTVAEYLKHGLRWAIGLRHIRPGGHLGTLFTHGLPWSFAAAAVAPSSALAAAYIGAYVGLRFLMAWVVGIWGLKDPVLKEKWWLIPVRDLCAFLVWVASFGSNQIIWRGAAYTISEGRLVPVDTSPLVTDSVPTKLGAGNVKGR